ncbi:MULTISPECIES: TrkH family potassium uptake protein [Halopseudomonas]|uniref:Trk system potassium uptake protein n=1 Tax=Halopseudomonas bauzanensis TaxID=653930 RepID=A0A1H9STB7_9GAMM|nr:MULTISPECIES: TrkH family potassium uptake protein [Halopseudomonas]WGK61707.1 TrkH family potassium uptake protein [Halopseudomonas sp. SMJS2]SER87643.1 trk system potassium uptake protein TrkH [Halopseudomonas bauzanensis]SFL93217.1 trk system potassium uptake protein TrkH [Halopseudomonas bauzanensis]
MQYSQIQRILGILLMLFSTSMLPAAAVGFHYGEHAREAFLVGFAITLVIGLLVWLPVRHRRNELRTRDGYLITVLFWLVLGLFGAVPLYLLELPDLTVADAVFESFSGLTTTGATVITGLDTLPRSLLFYRQQLQWFGGMGIIVLAVAILPLLGVGGMQLYRAEMPGPLKENKLTPRIAETAKVLWFIYTGLTLACAGAYWLAGMSLFDAIGHSFSTVAIGGFSTHDASIGYYDSPLIELICVLFMVISGINFALHFTAWRFRSIRSYWQDPECRTYLLILLGLFVISAALLSYSQYYDVASSLRFAAFQTVSIATTTGFTVTDFASWPSVLPFMLLYASFVGACAGSTGGGMKVIRVVLVFKQGVREIKRLLHTNGVFPVKLGSKPVGDRVVEAVWGFCSVYVFTFALLFLLLLGTGLDFVTAFSALTACMNNLGPGLGDVAAHYGDMTATVKWILSFAMLLGRLEVFTLLVLLTPMFWRR